MHINTVDPFSNQVSIPEEIIPYSAGNPSDVTDSPERVIECPALLLTSCESHPGCCTADPCENHYLRLVNSKDTLLISARKADGKWIAYNCLFNPSVQQLAPFLRNNRQIL